MLPPQTTSFNNSFAYSVAVSGKDIYVAGQNPTGCLIWKNGIQQPALTKAFDITDVAVVGNDVYVTGEEFNPTDLSGIATVWKNGQPTVLAPDAKSSYAAAIKISGKDVFICGSVQYPGTYPYAVYWKNGVMTRLPADSLASSANSIAFEGSDVYFAGNLESTVIPVYWKNGQMVSLAPASMNSGASGIAVSGGDVYVTGGLNYQGSGVYKAFYWKNGQIHYLTDPAWQSFANAIVIYGNDVYIAGMAASPNGSGYNAFEAVYWKNGNMVTLPYSGGPGYRYTFGIDVVGRN
jgi:hypothetical protein